MRLSRNLVGWTGKVLSDWKLNQRTDDVHKRIACSLCILPRTSFLCQCVLAFYTKPQKTKNIFKKCLTKEGCGDIISRLSARGQRQSQPGMDKYRKVFVELAKRVRSLKIEQQREKYKASLCESIKCVKIQNLAILKENTTQTKVKRANQAW